MHTYINETASLGERVQRLLEALDEVLLVLDSDGEAHKAVGDAHLEPVLREHVSL